MTAEDLRHQFHNEQGISWENSQGEPDIDYVMWLEQKVIRLKAKMPSEEDVEVEAIQSANRGQFASNYPHDWQSECDGFLKGAEWFRNRMTEPNNSEVLEKFNERPKDRLKCPHCGEMLSPSGGALDGSAMFWSCWDCNYKIDDIASIELKGGIK
jgi:hypothetical protein